MTPRQALRSSRGERLAHTPILGANRGEPATAAGRRAAHARHRLLGVLPAPLAPADAADRRARRSDEWAAALLPRRTRGARRARVRDAEVPDAATAGRGTARAVPGRGARPADACRDDANRGLAPR